MKIEIAGVSKIYGSKRALDQVRIELPPGCIVAVVGLNGAGKSTLLHCLEAPSSIQPRAGDPRIPFGPLEPCA